MVARDTLRDVVCVLECLRSTSNFRNCVNDYLQKTPTRCNCQIERQVKRHSLERRKRDKFDHLPEFGQLSSSFLHLFKATTNSLRLQNDLVKAIAYRGLLEKVIDSRHVGQFRCSSFCLEAAGRNLRSWLVGGMVAAMDCR